MSKRDSKPVMTPPAADVTAKVSAPERPDSWDRAGGWLARHGALPPLA